GMKGGQVVGGARVGAGAGRRAPARLEDEHGEAFLDEPRGERAAARARAHDDVVRVPGGRILRLLDAAREAGSDRGLQQIAAAQLAHQKVLRKAISARLSSSDRAGSSGNRRGAKKCPLFSPTARHLLTASREAVGVWGTARRLGFFLTFLFACPGGV